MAILHNGLFGKVTGRLGNTVVYGRYDKLIARMAGRSTKPPTEKQLANWMGMSVVAEFLKPVKALIDLGFAEAARLEQMYAQNKAVSVNKRKALTGVYPSLELDYARAMLSIGDLPVLEELDLVQEADGLRFSWEVGAWMPFGSSANDRVLLLAYLPEVAFDDRKWKRAYFDLDGARRDAGAAFLQLPAELLSMRVEVYVLVISNDRRRVSDSQYVGRLN